jgi:hypothetical protein
VTRSVFACGALLFTLSCAQSLDPKACSNHDAGWCGPEMWCERGSGWSRCRPLDEKRDDAGSAEHDALDRDASIEVWSGSGRDSDVVTPDVVTPDVVTPDVSANGSGLDAVVSGDTHAPDVRGCSPACSVGERRCGTSGGAQECALLGGCAYWTSELACASPKVCNPATGTCTCSGSCAEGAQRCGPNGGLQTCSMSSSGCPAWSSEVTCQTPATCKENGQLASCTCGSAGCVLGTKQCGLAGGTQTCTQNGPCTNWSLETPCPTGTSCHPSGQSVTCCTNACTVGDQRCGQNGGVQTCAMIGACADWGAENSPCQGPKVCQQMGKAASCTCPIGSGCVVGATRCSISGTGTQACVSASGCTVWGPEVTCSGAGSVCQQGACVCRRQIAGNRLFNAGFDANLDGWNKDKATWSSNDADSCSGSGSVSFRADDAGAISTDCFTLNPADSYNFGVKVWEPATSMYHGNCQLNYFTGPGCVALSPGDSSLWITLFSGNSSTWQSLQMSWLVPGDIHSGSINCGPGGSGGTGTFYFDQVYLTKSPGTF